ncbi:MAG: hypothetical protein HYT43_00060 [Candidatus Taylorbacteria bacterium]|nr:hypothetical protein [Candidatus Taylorbacteria bacterium]
MTKNQMAGIQENASRVVRICLVQAREPQDSLAEQTEPEILARELNSLAH